MEKKCCDGKNLGQVRDTIDMIDKEIVPLLARRACCVAHAARLKETREDVVVPERIEDVVSKARTKASEAQVSPDLVETIYRGMINAYIGFEEEEWDKLHEEKG